MRARRQPRKVLGRGLRPVRLARRQAATGSASVSSQTRAWRPAWTTRLTPNWIGGIAGGYSDSNFSVSGRATTGTVEGGHSRRLWRRPLRRFLRRQHTGYDHYNNTTDRSSPPWRPGSGEGPFSSDEWVSRTELGLQIPVGRLST